MQFFSNFGPVFTQKQSTSQQAHKNNRTLWPVRVFTQLTSNIKGFACKLAHKTASASSVNWALLNGLQVFMEGPDSTQARPPPWPLPALFKIYKQETAQHKPEEAPQRCTAVTSMLKAHPYPNTQHTLKYTKVKVLHTQDKHYQLSSFAELHCHCQYPL